MSASRWKQSGLPAHQKYLYPKVPLLIAGSYAIVSALWIAFSDKALSSIAGGYAHYQTLQTYKGWGFVAVSALLIFYLLRMAWKDILAAYGASSESERRLQLALTSAGGGIWELDLSENGEQLSHVSGELIRRLGLPPDYRLTVAELRSRRHPDDNEEAELKLAQAIASGGTQPYDVRYRVRCEDGLYRWVQLRGSLFASADGRTRRMVGVALDIDEQVRAKQRFSHLLRYDPVTGLSRQGKFIADVDDALGAAPSDRWLALVQLKLLDLDRLIDDVETAEDAALIRLIGDRLHDLPGVLVSRIASDVFALAALPASSPVAAQQIIRNAMERLLAPVRMADGPVKLRVQAGGAIGHPGADTAIGLLRNSGHALELADRTTATEAHWFNEALGVDFSTRIDRIRGLDSAVLRKEIECHYQPLVDLRTGKTSGFEALARWQRQDGRLVMPDDFIGLAEEVGKIAEIGEEVLRQACELAATWPAPHPFIAVNVSPLQLEDPLFPGIVARVLRTTGLSPTRLELEITENALPRDPAIALQRILDLRDLGVLVAIDDFGTGYSSLALLSETPFTRLKIDRSFVSGDGNARLNTIIIDTIINLAQNLDLSTTAEGIETADQALMLAVRGVDLAQGFYFSQPVPAAQASELITKTWPLLPASSDKHPGLRLVQ